MRAAALAVLLLAGCAGPERVPPAVPGFVLLEVPYFARDGERFGPAALAGALVFWGRAADPAQLSGEIRRGSLKGSYGLDLLLAARAHDLDARLLTGGLEALRRELASGRPVIVSLEDGRFALVTGYDEAGVFAHAGGRKNAHLPYRAFLRQWGKTRRWALSMKPWNAA